MFDEFFVPSFLLLLAFHCLASCFYDYLKAFALAWADGFTLFQLGLPMLWNSPATNWPTFSEIIPSHLHRTVFAIKIQQLRSH